MSELTVGMGSNGLLRASAVVPCSIITNKKGASILRAVEMALNPQDSATFECNVIQASGERPVEYSIELNPYLTDIGTTLAVLQMILSEVGVDRICCASALH